MLRKLLISLMITVAVAVGARPQTVPGRGAPTLQAEGGKITESGPDRGPGDITAGADGHMWFVELNGRADNRQVDGNRIGRITLDGMIAEFPMPSAMGSPVNIAVGPDRNIWYTEAGRLGRVTPEA